MFSSRSRHLAQLLMMSAAGLSGAQPAIPSAYAMGPTTTMAAPRRRFPSRYPFTSARQDARRYETVIGRNGHATMRRIA